MAPGLLWSSELFGTRSLSAPWAENPQEPQRLILSRLMLFLLRPCGTFGLLPPRSLLGYSTQKRCASCALTWRDCSPIGSLSPLNFMSPLSHVRLIKLVQLACTC